MKVFWWDRAKGSHGADPRPEEWGREAFLCVREGSGEAREGSRKHTSGKIFAKRDFSGGEKIHRYKPKGEGSLQSVAKEFQPGRWFEPRAEIRCRTSDKAGRRSAFCVGRRGGDTAERRPTPVYRRARSGGKRYRRTPNRQERKRGEKRCSEPFRAGSAQEVPFCGQKPGGLQKKRKRTKVRNGRAGKKETRSGRFPLARFGGVISKKQEG